ncbi:DUF6168 family protein [Sediminicola luteus]|uniref:Uncharacterized protein n=1 Tax=Sediminicola luteus TaxID=319238 RepID=A0A2A4GF37_9FLAO|nr:DUF6168 family protein [Sediminicola luteus]PCE66395.1 hypothetical protein B7P33_03620 [Sediminicola luteus]
MAHPQQKITLRFIWVLPLVLGLGFAIHLGVRWLQDSDLWAHQIRGTYLFNGIMALGIYILLYAFRKRLKHQLGFLYMAGSLLKFALFFFIFYPGYQADGDMVRAEFLSFFAPYVICLSVGTLFTAKMLQSMDTDAPKPDEI